MGDRPGRPWTVLFTERHENRAIARAVAMTRGGEVGRVVHVTGAGPHELNGGLRPEWFWDPTRSGGILVEFTFRSLGAEQRAEAVWRASEPSGRPYTGQFQAFVDALPSDPLPVTLAGATATVELVTAFYASARTGESISVPIPAGDPARECWGQRTE